MQLNHHRRGVGEPLVLIHGIGSHWQIWEPVLDRLAAEREVIALDLPGFGESPMPPAGTPPGPESLAKLVVEFLDELGVARPHAAGNSLGGWVSLELAKQERVRSVTCFSPAGFHNRAEAAFQRASLWTAARIARLTEARADRLARSARARKLTWSQYAAKPERIPAAEVAAAVKALAHAPWFDETLRAITGAPFGGGERIAVSVTIAWGEQDRLLLPRQAPRATAAIPGSKLLMLPGCGHVPTYDDPDRIAEVLLEGSAS